MHKTDPVQWHSWGTSTTELAVRENKPLLICIGYSACHWCHVMQEENFTDSATASRMNEHFICVLVDREQRPDIDQTYQQAVQYTNGNGGWPLQVVAMPDGSPLAATTYLPRKEWNAWLEKMTDQISSGQAGNNAAQFSRALREINQYPLSESGDGQDLFQRAAKSFLLSCDTVFNGISDAPGFPMSAGYEFLLHYAVEQSDSHALQEVCKHLDELEAGGIHDQLGGGFFRYTTDKQWHSPHFEKMLTDQAQLIQLFSHAYRATGIKHYLDVAQETTDFVLKYFRSESGGFGTSMDAGRTGEEGKFYTWTYQEVSEIVGKNAPLIEEFHVTMEGNCGDGTNIPYRSPESLKNKANRLWVSDLQKLKAARNNRIPPGFDGQSITAYNAMFAKALADVYQASGNTKYLEEALLLTEWILAERTDTASTVYRRSDRTNSPQFLDDFACSADACLALYQITFDENWLRSAQRISDRSLVLFDNSSGPLHMATAEGTNDLLNFPEMHDTGTPSANSVMAHNFYVLGSLLSDTTYSERSARWLSQIRGDVVLYPAFHGIWANLLIWMADEPYVVCLAGKNAKNDLPLFEARYLPNVIFAGTESYSSLPILENKQAGKETTYYVCRNKTCLLPTTDFHKALIQLVR